MVSRNINILVLSSDMHLQLEGALSEAQGQKNAEICNASLTTFTEGLEKMDKGTSIKNVQDQGEGGVP